MRPTILPNVTTVLVDVLEFAEGLDDVDVLASPGDYELGALVQAVIEDLERLEDVSPVLALVVESLVNHVHDVVEVVGSAVEDRSAMPLEAHGM